MSTPPVPLVAAAHGTRDLEGPRVLGELLELVRERLPGVGIHIGYVDVIEPALTDALKTIGGSAVVVPMFLASGYHVRVDVPAAVKATGDRAVVSPALGPDAGVVAAVADRLQQAGTVPDAVVMAAAGSSDARARSDVELAAERLAERLECRVVPAYVTAATPSVPDAVEEERAGGANRVGVASYLLAPGLFQRRLHQSGADVVAPPIGSHEWVADLIASRYRGVVEEEAQRGR